MILKKIGVKSRSSANDNGHHQMRHRTHVLLFPKQYHSHYGKMAQMLLEYLDMRWGMMTDVKDASEDEAAFAQLGVFGTG